MGADGAARDVGWPRGVRLGDHNSQREHPFWAPDSWGLGSQSPQRALTEEQQRGRAKDRPYLAWTTPNAVAGIYEMASTNYWFVTDVTDVTAETAPVRGRKTG